MKATFGFRSYGYLGIRGTIEARHISWSSVMKCQRCLGDVQSVNEVVLVEVLNGTRKENGEDEEEWLVHELGGDEE